MRLEQFKALSSGDPRQFLMVELWGQNLVAAHNEDIACRCFRKLILFVE